MLKNLAGWVQGQLLHQPELLWRKLEVRACPPFPWEMLLSWGFTAPPHTCYITAAAPAPSVRASPVWPWPSVSASRLDLRPASSLLPCRAISELSLILITVPSPDPDLDLLLCIWAPCQQGHSLLCSIMLCSRLTFPCGPDGPRPPFPQNDCMRIVVVLCASNAYFKESVNMHSHKGLEGYGQVTLFIAY